MGIDAREIARKLACIQSRLRKDLVEELQEHEEEIEDIFDPHSYSPVVQELREKYLTRLYTLQAILQELAHQSMGRRQPSVQVLSLHAEDSEKLVSLVNKHLARLNGVKVQGIEFLQNKQDDQWVALITYLANPFTEARDETAAWM